MRYFDLSDDVTIPRRWHLGEVTTSQGDVPRFLAGRRWEGREPLAVTLDAPGRPLDFCLTSFAVPVARSRLAAIIADIADGDVQRLPLTIPGHHDFEVINAVRVIKCVDESRAEFTRWSLGDHRPELAGSYRMVTKLKVQPSAIPADAHVFRIEGWLVAIVVSEALKTAMEATGCFGAKFVEVT